MGLLAFATHLPSALAVLQLNPDAVEFIDIARRLLAGQGYLLGVKAFHFTGTDVLHPGLTIRPPLYPVIAATVLGVGLDVVALQVLNAAFAGACAALVFVLGSELFDRRVGALAGVLWAFSPVSLIYLTPPMAEAPTTFCLLLGSTMLVRRSHRWSGLTHSAAGLAFGMAYLARPSCALLALVALFAVIVESRGRPERRQRLLLLVLGLAVAVLPMSVYSFVTRGSLAYSAQSYLYSVRQDNEVYRFANFQPLPTPIEFVTGNFQFVLSAVAQSVRGYAALLLFDLKWLLLLSPGWLAGAVTLVRGPSRPNLLPLALAGANFLVAALTWANFQERYLVFTLALLIPYTVWGLQQLGLGRRAVPGLPCITPLTALVVAVAIFWSPYFAQAYRGLVWSGDYTVAPRDTLGVRWTGPRLWAEDPDLDAALAWIDHETGPTAVLAHDQPWPLTFFTSRPATLLPRRLDAASLEGVLVRYRVDYVLLARRSPAGGDYAGPLERLAPRGVTGLAVAGYRIFDTRALWREAPQKEREVRR